MANPTQAMPLKELNQATLGCETPPLLNHQQKNDANLSSKDNIEDIQNSRSHTDNYKCKVSTGLGTPDRLLLPKPFKYPERYTSPTDHILSPISKGLLARKTRKGGALLPPSIIQSKIQELRSPSVERNHSQMEQ